MVTNQTTPRYGIQITTVDPSQGIIKGVMKGDAQERSILVVDIPNAFRWPQVGESWMVVQMNGTWYLEGSIPSQAMLTEIRGLDAGDLVLDTPTGVVQVMGSSSGSTDFTFDQNTWASAFQDGGGIGGLASQWVMKAGLLSANCTSGWSAPFSIDTGFRTHWFFTYSVVVPTAGLASLTGHEARQNGNGRFFVDTNFASSQNGVKCYWFAGGV